MNLSNFVQLIILILCINNNCRRYFDKESRSLQLPWPMFNTLNHNSIFPWSMEGRAALKNQFMYRQNLNCPIEWRILFNNYKKYKI